MNVVRLAYLLFLCAGLPTVATRAGDSIPTQHPFLLITAAKLQQIKNEIQDSGSWKNKSWRFLQKNADQLLRTKIEIPPRGGNWEQYYVGPSGYGLKLGKIVDDWQWEHIDTITGQTLRGDSTQIKKDYDGVIIASIHNSWALGALQLGLAYQLSGNKVYAKKARAILLDYAALYPTLPLRNREMNSGPSSTGVGKIHVQNLNEAIWLIDMAQAADLIWNTLTNDEQHKILDDLLIPGANLLTSTRIADNIQCWENAAVGIVGFLAHDERLIHRAMDDTLYGFNAQIRQGIGKDGMWIEPTLNYHFFALHALIQLGIAARNYGYPADMKSLEKMFKAPLTMCNENYLIPAFNNSEMSNLSSGERYFYEWAWSEYGDKEFIPLINSGIRQKFVNIGPHFTGWGLLYGENFLPVNSFLDRPPVTSKYFPDMGVAMLSENRRDDNLVCYMKFNTRRATHAHPDNLAFDIMKGKENVVVLSGTTNYSSPLYTNWYKHTISSNTFLVGEQTQKPTIGKCLSFGKTDQINYVIAENSNIYDFPHCIRTIALLNSNLVLIFDQVNVSPGPKLLDIAIHPSGKWKGVPTGNSWQDTTAGYNLISRAKVTSGLQGEIYASTTLRSGREVMISARQDSSMDIITGYGQQYLNNDIPVAIFRRRTDHAVMVWCIALNGEKVKISMDGLSGTTQKLLDLTTVAKLTLEEPDGGKWTLVVNPYKVPIKNEPGWEGKDLVVLERPKL